MLLMSSPLAICSLRAGAAVDYGTRSLESGDLLGSLPFFADALRLEHERHGDEAAHRMRLGLILAQCPKLTHLWSEGGQINDAEFSPDGKMVVVSLGSGFAKIFDLDTDACSKTFAQADIIETATFTHDGRLIAASSDDFTACIIDSTSLANISRIPHPDRVKSARFSPNDLKLVTACRDGVVRVWNAKSGAREVTVSHGGKLWFADFNSLILIALAVGRHP
jgi:WD40 repeat protein